MGDAEIHPELFIKDQNIDRRKCKRVVPMEVLNLSMPRSGTMSMKFALETLGYHEVYHFFNTFSNMRDHDMWIPLLYAKYNEPPKPIEWWRDQFDHLLGHCMALSDTPSIFFVEELLAAYPDVKVILVERDFDSWMKSFDIVIQGMFGRRNWIGSVLDPKWMGRLRAVSMGWARGHFHADTEAEMRANARKGFQGHNSNVRKLVPKEKLLEYRLGSGWGPLCEFLGKEVPKEEFPKVNESDIFKDKVHIIRKRSLIASATNVLLVFSSVAAAGCAVWWQFFHR
ncbi:hypothetical protein EG329_001483 [Mollisiaceae sp. DMI_Dod_QoI]|nr:hypothetical protein EG329_001483 [Helotiales sp. DMI_Dod_QoI]